MAYHREIFARIRESYEEKARRAELAAEERRRELQEVIPGLKELDLRLSGFGLRIMEQAMEGGDVKAGIAELQKENEDLQKKRRQLLMDAGFPADYSAPRYECKLCSDHGYVGLDMCVCMKKKLNEASMEYSGMAELMRRQTFENFSVDYYASSPENLQYMRQVTRDMKNYAEHFGENKNGLPRNLLFLGGTGLGKTHLSSAIAGVVLEKGNDVFYNSATGMFADFEAKRFGNASANGSAERVSRYTECDLLILDDLGTEVVNQFTQSVLYDVINTRLNREKATVINTNLTSSELRDTYHDRITSRLLGEYYIVPFRGTDIRKQKLEKKNK